MSKKLHFKTNTLLKNLIGKDLINDDSIAVIELVKNAYDARSDSVLIRFDNAIKNRENSRLVISDEGSGMDATDIEDKWLNIAYSEKKSLPTKKGAYFAGNKGIGRFSCDRLGETLDLLTRRKGGALNHLRIDWPAFEKEGEKDQTIQKVTLSLETISPAKAEKLSGVKMPPHGTILVISRLRSAWNRDKLLELKRSLEKFLNPNQLFEQKRFSIVLAVAELKSMDKDTPYLDRINGLIENQIFTNLKFKSTFIECSINEDGKTVSTTLTHEGEPVFRLKERNHFDLKNIKAVIYYLNPYKKAYFKRQTGTRSIDFGSIFLFLNGFRIAPYGERGDDWLGLDVRKTQGRTRNLGSRELVGRIEIVDNEDSFKPVSSREGLKKTEAFEELKESFILDVIKRLEKFVVDGLDWDSIPERLRQTVGSSEGLDWTKTAEEYSESWEKKRQRIALSIMTFIGSTPERIISFWFNPALLEGLSTQRTEEVNELLSDIGGFEPGQVDSDLKKGLAKIRKLVESKSEEARLAKTEVSNLRVAVAEQGQKVEKLIKETGTYRAQALFLQSVTSLDAKQLMAYHHEIFLNSNIVDNFLAKAIKTLRTGGKIEDALRFLEKTSLANKRMAAIAQFATKANFKSATGKEMTDIPAFVEQYVLHVARDFIATGLKLVVKNSVKESFEVKARRIELSILIDNIISNATKAQAGTLEIDIAKSSPNTLLVLFRDDGNGLSPAIQSPSDIFELGVTTTVGSGLGMFHAKQIVTDMGGLIEAVPLKPKGFEIRVEIAR